MRTFILVFFLGVFSLSQPKAEPIGCLEDMLAENQQSLFLTQLQAEALAYGPDWTRKWVKRLISGIPREARSEVLMSTSSRANTVLLFEASKGVLLKSKYRELPRLAEMLSALDFSSYEETCPEAQDISRELMGMEDVLSNVGDVLGQAILLSTTLYSQFSDYTTGAAMIPIDQVRPKLNLLDSLLEKIGGSLWKMAHVFESLSSPVNERNLLILDQNTSNKAMAEFAAMLSDDQAHAWFVIVGQSVNLRKTLQTVSTVWGAEEDLGRILWVRDADTWQAFNGYLPESLSYPLGQKQKTSFTIAPFKGPCIAKNYDAYQRIDALDALAMFVETLGTNCIDAQTPLREMSAPTQLANWGN